MHITAAATYGRLTNSSLIHCTAASSRERRSLSSAGEVKSKGSSSCDDRLSRDICESLLSSGDVDDIASIVFYQEQHGESGSRGGSWDRSFLKVLQNHRLDTTFDCARKMCGMCATTPTFE